MKLEDEERIEIRQWEISETERPGVFSPLNLINKVTDAPVLLSRLEPFREPLASARTILELGAGQGWASCLLQSLGGGRPTIIATDISRFALQSLGMWEGIFRCRLAGASACRAYRLPFRDGAFDVVFAFQAAHHFRRHGETLEELYRILRPGGIVLYLHEPTSPRWIYPLAVHRARSVRPEVPEDLLLVDDMLRAARAAGFEASARDDTSLEKRGTLAFLYYAVLRVLPPLRRVLPCTRDFVFTKPGARSS